MIVLAEACEQSYSSPLRTTVCISHLPEADFQVLERAAALDQSRTTGRLSLLHGIPIILKSVSLNEQVLFLLICKLQGQHRYRAGASYAHDRRHASSR